MATDELALELQIAPNHLDNDQDASADFFSQLFDGENWEELPSFDDIRSKMQEHHESIKRIQKSCHKKVHYVVDSLIFQTLCVLVVIFDFILALTSIINDQDILSYLTMSIIALYVIEMLLRIYAYGFKKFFTSILNIIDFIAVMGSLILYIYSIYAVYALLVKILRWIRVARSTYKAIFSRTKKIQQAIRNMQRSNLIGYKDDKYDLDITYITDHILIMSRPAVKKIKQFQHDSLTDVKNFLDEKHKDHYKIFDLCVYDDEETDKSNPNLTTVSASEEHLSSPAFVDHSSSNLASSVLSFFPINVDKRDGIKNTEYAVFGADIINDYAFTGITVLPLEKVFEFAETATQFTDENAANVIVIQSTSGLGRSMFMTACLLFYYYPTASLADVIRFIQHGRVACSDKDKKDDSYMFRKFVPSQLRYYRYFGTLITHCSKLSEIVDDEDDVDEMDMELDRGLTHHVQTMHYHHQQSLYEEQLIATINAELDEFALSSGSKWNFYHEAAMDMLNARIGIVIKHIAIYNYFDEIDPYVNWECDIFQWKQNDNNGMNVLSCVEYDTYKYGVDTKPGKNSALIRRYEHAKTRVIEKDFGLRIYKSKTNDEEEHKRKLCAQLILHSHFINLDEENCITFKKEEIDFVNRDENNKHFPQDFNIVVKAKILRKKA